MTENLMKTRLIERCTAPAQARDFPIDKPEFLIGRGSDCDLRLRNSSVSRHHCIIRTSGTDVTLVDLGSINGTFVNGQRMRSQLELHSGDELRLGTSQFLVDLGDRDDLDFGLLASTDSLSNTVEIEPRRKSKKSDGGSP
jgi:pSer/pThr/pTyr-binding forkhead associated (FHA) protein